MDNFSCHDHSPLITDGSQRELQGRSIKEIIFDEGEAAIESAIAETPCPRDADEAMMTAAKIMDRKGREELKNTGINKITHFDLITSMTDKEIEEYMSSKGKETWRKNEA